MWNRKATHKTIWTGVMLFVSITLLLQAAIDDPNKQTSQASPSQQQTQMGTHFQAATQAGVLCRANDLIGSTVNGTRSDGVKSTVNSTRSDGVRSNELRKNRSGQRMSDQAYDLTGQNEKIGTVKELFIDGTNNEISYVVVASDNKYYPVPWRAFNVQQTGYNTAGQRTAAQGTVGQRAVGDEATRRVNGNQSTADYRESWSNQEVTTRTDPSSSQKPTLYLNITKEQLLQAPTISAVTAGDLSNSQLNQTVNTFYSQHFTRPDSSRQGQPQLQKGTAQRETQTARQGRTTEQGRRQAETGLGQPAASQLTAANLLKTSEVIGLGVKNSADVNLGSINDLVIDTREGQIAYGLVSFGGFLTMGQKIAAVPWTALTVQMPQRLARIEATQTQLDAVVLEKGSIDKLSEPQFAQNIHTRFNAKPYGGIYGYVPAGREDSELTEPNRQQEQQQWNPNQDQEQRNPNQDQGQLRP